MKKINTPYLDKVKKGAKLGMSDYDVAGQLGTTRQHVQRIRRAYGIKISKKKTYTLQIYEDNT